MIYFEGENSHGEKSSISVKEFGEENEIIIHIEDGEEIPQTIYLDINIALKFRKALTHEIQKAKNKLYNENKLNNLKKRFLKLGFKEKSFNTISSLEITKLESYIYQLEKEAKNG